MKPVSTRLAPAVGVIVIMVLMSGAILAQALEPPLTVSDGVKVTVEFTTISVEKTGEETKLGKDQTSYVHGNREILPNLEKALTGMKVGEKKRVTLAPEEAYGQYDEMKRVTVGKDLAPPDVKVGSTIRAPSGISARILAVEGDKVTVDTNHPLAGKTIAFDVNILKLQKSPKASKK